MSADADTDLRLKELVAKIEVEQNPKTFSVLVEELNQLLDCGKSVQSQPVTIPESPPARHKNTSAMPGGAA